MNWQASAHALTTPHTIPVLLSHNDGPGFLPTTPAIRFRTADPIRGLLAGFVQASMFVTADRSAVSRLTAFSYPRLSSERLTAVIAGKFQRFYPRWTIRPSHIFRAKSVRGLDSFSPRIPQLMTVWHLPVLSEVPL